MRGKPWTDKRIGLLRQLWAEGESATAIAARLRVSRAAVLGKVFRLRLDPERDSKPRRAEAAVPPPRSSGRPAAGKTLLELNNATCRFPVGEPGTPHFHFCGAAGADLENGKPYCDTHMRRAFVHYGKGVAAAPAQAPGRAARTKSPSIVPPARETIMSKTPRRRA